MILIFRLENAAKPRSQDGRSKGLEAIQSVKTRNIFYNMNVHYYFRLYRSTIDRFRSIRRTGRRCSLRQESSSVTENNDEPGCACRIIQG